MINSTINKKEIIIKEEKYIKKIRSFLERLVILWGIHDISILEIEYIGEVLLEGEELIRSDLTFKKINSLYSHLTLLVPVHVSQEIFKKVKNINNREAVRILSDTIIYLYNSSNPRSYISKYNNNIPILVSDEFYKKNIYKVIFEIFGKKEYLYFNIDGSQLFV